MKKIIIILSLLFVIFSFSPSLYEIYQSKLIPPDRVFVLEHNYMFDYNFYLSRIREGQPVSAKASAGEGRWTVVEKYYNQPHQGSLFQIIYLLAGKVGGILGFTPPFIYHLMRLLFGLILLILSGFYVMKFLPRWWGIIAYLFIATSGSFPILTKVGTFFRFSTHMGNWSAIDSLQRITFLPHVLLGQIFILLFIWRFGSEENMLLKSLKLPKLLMWGIFGFIAGIIFPPALIVVYTVFGVLTAVEILFEFFQLKSPASPAGKLKLLIPRIIFILLSFPSLLYMQLMFRILPWKALALFDVLHRMPLPYMEYFLALGPVLPLGLAGLVSAFIRKEKKLFPVVAWVLGIFLLFAVFEKVPTQSPLRFTEALINVPLGILSAYLFYYLFYFYKLVNLNTTFKRSLQYGIRFVVRIVMTVIILLGLGVMVSMVGWLTDQAVAKRLSTWTVPIGAQLSYPTKDFMDAIYFIRDHTKREDVVLTYVTAGNFIPAYAGNYVYIGHANTPDEDGKEKIAAQFFSGKMTPDEAKEFLTKERISYIFFGPQEREVGGNSDLFTVYPFVESVYINQEVTIYKLKK